MNESPILYQRLSNGFLNFLKGVFLLLAPLCYIFVSGLLRFPFVFLSRLRNFGLLFELTEIDFGLWIEILEFLLQRKIFRVFNGDELFMFLSACVMLENVLINPFRWNISQKDIYLTQKLRETWSWYKLYGELKNKNKILIRTIEFNNQGNLDSTVLLKNDFIVQYFVKRK